MYSKPFHLLVLILMFLLAGQAIPLPAQADHTLNDDPRFPVRSTRPLTTGAESELATNDFNKYELWTGKTQLRGANVWQRIVVPKVDGSEFLGDGHVGPPYVQEDFDRLAALGANYVNVSGPGLFTEKPPYVLDEAAQANLDNILSMIAQADMFAVITFRTGPGRSDFTFYEEPVRKGGDPSRVIEDVWVDQAAQDAWAVMWRYTAARYHNNPIVVGYDLMCEPNAPGRLLDIWDGDTFYQSYAGTLYDWNQFYPRLVEAIRKVDSDTPILIGAMGWSAVSWLPYLKPVKDSRTVYMVHQYEPQDSYTQQAPSGKNTYPGTFDLNWDNKPDQFNNDWLNQMLTTVDAFREKYGVPVGVSEFGLMRWVPNGAAYMRDLMGLFEKRGMNHALWVFNPAWTPFAQNDDFDFLHGPDPNNHSNVATSKLIEAVRAAWKLNSIRPSNVNR